MKKYEIYKMDKNTQINKELNNLRANALPGVVGWWVVLIVT